MRNAPFIFLMVTACGGRSPVAPFDPSLETSAQILRFAGEVNDVLAPQYVSIVDANGLNLEWHATTSSSWVHLSTDHGNTPTNLRVTVSTRGLAPGTHRAGVALSIEGGGENATGASFVVELTLDAPGWRALDGPRGAWVTSLAVNPESTNIIVAGAEDGDLQVSADNGNSFSQIDLNSTEPFSAVVFADGNRAYAGAEGVYRSDDGGLSWNLAGLANRTVWWLAVDPTNMDRLLVEGDGLWRSVDGGANWEEITVSGGSWCLTGDPTRPGTFLVGSDFGVVYTTNATAGAGVAAVTSTGIADREVVSIAVLPSGRWVVAHDADASHSPGLRVSDDAGATWSNPGAAGLLDEEDNVYLWLTAIGDELFGLHKGLWRSRDGGETFESLSIGISNYRGDDRRFHAAVAHPDGLLLAHHSLGVIRYADGGSEQLQIYDFRINGIEVDATSGDIFGILSPGGVFTRSGGTFRGIGSGMYAEYPNDISLDPRSPASIAVSGEDNEVMLTTDGGVTWVRGGAGLAIEDGRRLSRAPDNPDVLWVAGASSGLFRTADNGATWTGLTGSTTYHVAAISATQALYFTDGQIWLADNATSNLTVLHDPNDSMTMLRRTSDGSHWFGGSDGLMRSTDNGQTFDDRGLANVHFYDIVTVPGDPSHVFVATSSGLLESRDGGSTWENTDCPFTVYSLAYDSISGVVVAGTFAGGVYTYSP